MQYVFAPMEGVTGYPFRNTHHEMFPGIDAYYTAFIELNPALRLRAREKRDLLPENNKGVPLIPQVMTNRADELAAACEMLERYGYREVNLNLGCPSGTVVKKHRGAALLAEPERLEALLSGFFESAVSARVRLSVKTRLGPGGSSGLPALTELLNRYPLSSWILHPRTQKQQYAGQPDLDAFRYAFGHSRIPLVYNGDVRTPADAAAMEAGFPGLECVMIGRGLLRNPALVREIRGGAKLTAAEAREWMERYTENQLREIPEFNSCLDKLKQQWGYLSQSFSGGEKALRRIRQASSRDGYTAAVNEFFREAEICI
ncbi:MAG: tRNA dihydrouridine synthase [Lachnospiraceae bacterium]